MQTSRILAGSLPALALLAPAGSAQDITTIVLEGDAIPSVGNVTLVSGLAVDDAGGVLVHVLTDNANPDTNAAMIDANGVVVVEGQAVTDPAGALIRSFNGGNVNVNAGGEPVFYIGLANAPGIGDEGVYHGTAPDLAILEASASTAPELPSGSTYQLMLPALINEGGELCFHTVVDDPNVSGTFDVSAIVVVDPVTNVQTAPYKEGDLLPGQTDPIIDFQWDFHGTAFNAAGSIFFGAETSAASSVDRVLYLDDTKIAQEGDPTPLGSSYTGLATSTRGLDLNDKGDYVFLSGLGNGSAAIFRNDEGFVQVGTTFPSIEPFPLQEFGQPLFIGNDGSVLWYGIWEAPAPVIQAKGLFLDYDLLVVQGETEIGGLVVEELSGLDRSFSMSPSGQYVVFEATLSGGLEGAFLIDLWQ